MPIRTLEALQVKGRGRGRRKPKKCLMEVLHNDMSLLGLFSPLIFDRAMWKRRIHVADTK